MPLNSPDPLASIERLAAQFGERALVGAGTVLDPADVGRGSQRRRRADHRLARHQCRGDRRTAAAGLVSVPGYFTPSEAFAAIRAGAHGAEAVSRRRRHAGGAQGAAGGASRSDVPVIVVGGVKPDTMQPGSTPARPASALVGGLYKPGQSPAETLDKARAYVAGVKRA